MTAYDYPCRRLPVERQCDHRGPGDFMGHTCVSRCKTPEPPPPPEDSNRRLMVVEAEQVLVLAAEVYAHAHALTDEESVLLSRANNALVELKHSLYGRLSTRE